MVREGTVSPPRTVARADGDHGGAGAPTLLRVVRGRTDWLMEDHGEVNRF